MQYVLTINPRGIDLLPLDSIAGYIVTVNWLVDDSLFETLDSAEGERLFIFREAKDWKHACGVARRAISDIPDRKLRRIFLRSTMSDPVESMTVTGSIEESGKAQGSCLAQLLEE